MKRREFLQDLEAALLENNIAKSIIDSNIAYYDNYINSRVIMGESEADIIEQLGNGRVIARTIIDAEKKGVKATYYSTPNGNNTNNTTSNRTNKSFVGKMKEKINKIKDNSYGFSKNKSYDNSNSGTFRMIYDNITWTNKLKIILGTVLVISVVILLAIFLFKMVVFLLPYILILMLVSFLFRRILR